MNQPNEKYFHIMLKAKFICLGYIMYNVYSSISKDIKIICVVSDYCIAKRPYSYHGVYHILLHSKENNTRHLHMM